ncbi:sigma-70 family RNA polymerase sigma factor [Echinicola sp. CAU 1574]|uniref:Sigma-70 family RNA polymerase sigma factor n=1 Tax=Echinicola arenosa TaxID=2774144 RepID=A0ABR9AK62_9BACT|nr:sigma-70 family RNA polymerase sigma factor [Echinicola arenosa]MBD8489100.1 sigma-70 family RNA polymerase sigma factor [Echinicola arenosa]
MNQKFENSTDKELWEYVKLNNEDAFMFLYDNRVDDLYRYAQRITQNFDLIEDSIQEVFTRLWENRQKIIITESFKFYVLRTFKRELLLQVKKASKITLLEKTSCSMSIANNSEAVIIEDEISNGKMDLLRRSMEHLSKRQREALHLRYIDSMSYEEVAEIMNIQVPTLYNMIFRAIKILKQDFKKYSFKYKMVMLIYIFDIFFNNFC